MNKEKYKNTFTGFKITYAEGGPKGMVLGWAPTAIGYSAQVCITWEESTTNFPSVEFHLNLA